MANLLSAHRDLANPAAPRRDGRAVGRAPTCRQSPGKTAVEMFEARGRRRDQGAVDRLHEPGAVDAGPGHGARARSSAPSSWSCRRRSRTTATCAFADLLLPATTWGEKDGTVTNSERRISRVRAGGAGAGRGARTTGRSRSTSRGGWKHVAARGRARADAVSLRATRAKRSGTSTANPRAAATSTSPGCATRCSTRAAAAMAVARQAQRRAARACTRTASSPPPTAAPASPTCRYVPRGRAARRALSVLAHHRPPARPMARHEPHRHAGPAVRPRRRAGDADASAGHGAPRA